MIVSAGQLTEVVYKGARGAGLPAGAARELAEAGRWLALHYPDGLDPLLAAIAVEVVVTTEADLGFRQTRPAGAGAPVCLVEPAVAAVHGPSAVDLVVAGAASAVELGQLDHWPVVVGLAGKTLATIANPSLSLTLSLMLSPSPSRSGARPGAEIGGEVEGGRAVVTADDLVVDGDLGPAPSAIDDGGHPTLILTLTREPAVDRRPESGLESGARPAQEPTILNVDDDLWLRARELMLRTYVPASEASRKSGAGAGEIDND